jgi:hypothetical protein
VSQLPLIAVAAVTIGLLTTAAASRSSASASRTLRFNVAFHDVEVDLGEPRAEPRR